ncbi:MAG: hypothetical protein OEN49_08590, partial [Gammaproteobacteria bacterium]|nr:hypothetical protein [Gammaproteobacteria bacterium]
MDDFRNLRKIALGDFFPELPFFSNRDMSPSTFTFNKGSVIHMKKYSILLAALLAMTAVASCEKKAPAPKPVAPATAPAPAAAPTADPMKPADATA